LPVEAEGEEFRQQFGAVARCLARCQGEQLVSDAAAREKWWSVSGRNGLGHAPNICGVQTSSVATGTPARFADWQKVANPPPSAQLAGEGFPFKRELTVFSCDPPEQAATQRLYHRECSRKQP